MHRRRRETAKLADMSSETVLVTGAAGFIGHHVVRLLRAEGRRVRALLRPGEDARNLDALGDPGIERVEGDILDRATLATHMAGCGVVYHLAAVYRTWVPDPKVLHDVNVTGTANVLSTAVALGVRRVVYTSSIAAIGVDPGGQPADERTPFNLWQDSFDYVRSKYLAHQVALAFAPILDLVVVNPACRSGPATSRRRRPAAPSSTRSTARSGSASRAASTSSTSRTSRAGTCSPRSAGAAARRTC
jgi:dihydroflavonol-4-reductase